jgi:excinuclease ABC subunit C
MYPKNTQDYTTQDVFEDSIMQFYDKNDPPPLIITNGDVSDIIIEAFAEKSVGKINIMKPITGDKKELLNTAITNAAEALRCKMNEKTTIATHLHKIQQAFNLPKIPRRIEVFDNSHISGTNSIGGMIVAGADGFMKSQYRRYNFDENVIAGDDYGMMRSMLMRRLMAIKDAKLADDFAASVPDLWLIDGGKGQQSVVFQVMQAVQFHIPFICIAKGPNRNAGEEDFYLEDGSVVNLPKGDSLLFYLQNIRDEAHNFAINSHRHKRAKSIMHSVLDEISGIGIKRKKQLLTHFGSLDAIRNASVGDIAKVSGINLKTAEKIYQSLR